MSSTLLPYLSLGSYVRPAVEPVTPRAKGRPKGRPKATSAEGGLSLGDKRPRALASKNAFEEEQERTLFTGALSYLSTCILRDL